MQTQFLNTTIDVSASLLPLRASAIVLDCDGLLADTEELWLRAVESCARNHGLTVLKPEEFRGVAIDAAAEQLAAKLVAAGLSVCAASELATTLSAEFQALIGREAAAMPGAVDLVGRLAARLPIAVASNSPRVLLDEILERVGLQSLITCSVARDEVSAAKPAPELYVAAVRKLHQLHPAVNAHTAVAFEDSAVGALAAISAGLLVVGVNTDLEVDLTCHVRLHSLLDPELVEWADVVERELLTAAEPTTFAIGTFDAATSILTVQSQFPTTQKASIEVYPQSGCSWDEMPVVSAVASADVTTGTVSLDLTDLPDGTYRYLLVTDGDVPEWNARTGEFVVGHAATPTVPAGALSSVEEMSVMTWNLWFGGCHANNGSAKQVAYLRQSPVGIVALQECFGPHGSRLASEIGWNIAQQGHDTAVISRYPLTLHHTETAPFATCVTVETPQGAVTVWSVHLWHSDYGPYTAIDPSIPARFTLATAGERRRIAQLADIVSEQARLEREGVVSTDDPVVIMGDFNVPSHLDWLSDRRGATVEWPTSRMLEVAGYVDAFRAVHTDPSVMPGDTWSPIIPEDEEPRDRIDFIFSRGARAEDAYTVAGQQATGGNRLVNGHDGHRPVEGAAGAIGEHLDNVWPTDHAAVIAKLSWT